MKDIVNQIHSLLIKNKKTIAVAESCTGGLLSKLLTDLSGSSKYFILGVVAYSNSAKQNILRIPSKIISEKGEVSKKVAQLMAKSVRNLAKTNFGIGITGIAGPGGAAPGKPVGTVFIAIDSKQKQISKKFHFTGSRVTIKEKAVLKTLDLLKLLVTSY